MLESVFHSLDQRNKRVDQLEAIVDKLIRERYGPRVSVTIRISWRFLKQRARTMPRLPSRLQPKKRLHPKNRVAVVQVDVVLTRTLAAKNGSIVYEPTRSNALSAVLLW